MKNKRLLFLIVIVMIIFTFFGIKRIVWNYKVAHAEKIVRLLRKEVFVYENVKVKNLLLEINGTLTTNPKVDTTKIGKQTIEFDYVTDEGYPVSYEIEIEVVDITPPMIFQHNNKTIYTGNKDFYKNLFCGDNYDKNPKCYIEGDYDVDTPGEYEVTFIGEDSSGNKAKNNFTLTVKKKPKSYGTSSNHKSKMTSYTDFKEFKTKYKQKDNMVGIDVSKWQGDINYKKVKDAGVEFAYIRIGAGSGIGEEYVLDEKFEDNIKGFNKVGIPVGVYYYSNANGKNDAIKEAKWILKEIKKYDVDLEIVFDWEDWNNFQEYNLNFNDVKEMAKEFNKTIKENNHTGMLYSSKSYLETIWGSKIQPIWLAHYTEKTTYPEPFKVWQVCDDGYVNGIKGYVDLDIRYK